MTSKRLIPALMLLTVLMFGCKKYEEGPGLSFRSKEARLANTWKVVSCTVGSTDYTSYYTNLDYSEKYEENGNYSYSSTNGSGAGKWEFQEDKEQIKRSGVSGQPSRDLIILKLRNKEFWYYFMDNGSRYEFHMEEK